jgi:hypothetical protein
MTGKEAVVKDLQNGRLSRQAVSGYDIDGIVFEGEFPGATFSIPKYHVLKPEFHS